MARALARPIVRVTARVLARVTARLGLLGLELEHWLQLG